MGRKAAELKQASGEGVLWLRLEGSPWAWDPAPSQLVLGTLGEAGSARMEKLATWVQTLPRGPAARRGRRLPGWLSQEWPPDRRRRGDLRRPEGGCASSPLSPAGSVSVPGAHTAAGRAFAERRTDCLGLISNGLLALRGIHKHLPHV